MPVTLYYFPFHAEFCSQAPLYFRQPRPTWKEFTLEVAKKHPKCKFYVDISTPEELKEQCLNLRAQCQEFM
jgi:hypothetical protein